MGEVRWGSDEQPPSARKRGEILRNPMRENQLAVIAAQAVQSSARRGEVPWGTTAGREQHAGGGRGAAGGQLAAPPASGG